MPDVPEFDLAPLTRFTPKVIRRERDDLDAFVLALALAYNDFKTADWLLTILTHQDPADAVTPYNAQISGMRIHAVRLLLGVVHELLKAIQAAHLAGLLRRREFLFCLDNIGEQGKSDWSALVEAATTSTHTDPFRKWLVRVRNSVVSHYYQPYDLHSGYRAYFYERRRSPHNEWAFASLGSTLEQSRFYFADAAVAATYDDVLDPDDTSMSVLRAHTPRVNSSLRGIVTRYIEARHILETGAAALTDQRPRA